MRLGWLITLLIFASVVPIYLLDTFVPILVGAPLIALIALWRSFALLRSGGSRHGRTVSVCFPAGGSGVRAPSAVTIGAPVPACEAAFRDGRLRAKEGGPPEAGRSLGA